MPKQRKKKNAEENEPVFPTAAKADPFGVASTIAKSKRWKPASDVLDEITAVPTIFSDFNRATMVGGLPVRRIHLVHGPSSGGKSVFVFGLIKSFIDRGYLGAYVDAEHAAGRKFADEVIGDLEQYPNFVGSRPDNYEETIADVDEILARAKEIKKKHPDFKTIVVVDSINKLVPKRELDKILTAGKVTDKGAQEMAKGHQGRYRASLNQAWLDHLTPKIAAADCAFVVIAQERDDMSTGGSFFGPDFKVKGGRALFYDSSLVCRVLKSSPVRRSSSDTGNEGILGFKHRVRIRKSKVGHLDGRYTDSVFHLSNGKLTPPGLDPARDAFHVAQELDLVKRSGAWYSWGRFRAQGENNFVLRLSKDSDKLASLIHEINETVRAA